MTFVKPQSSSISKREIPNFKIHQKKKISEKRVAKDDIKEDKDTKAENF